MFLSNLKLWNFRKFGSQQFDIDSPDLSLPFQKGLNVLIGENDSGKSAIIDSIKYVLRTHSYEWFKYETTDFFQNSERFRIELVFSELTDDEAKNFPECLSWKTIGEDKIPFLKLSLDVNRNEERILPSDVKAGNDEEGKQLSAVQKDYLKTTYLKPLRDAESDLIAKKYSRLSQILLADNAFRDLEDEHILVDIFESLSNDLENYFSGSYKHSYKLDDGTIVEDIPTEGKEIKDRIENYIKGFFSNKHTVDLESNKNDLKSILEKISLSLTLDKNPGLGTLNRLFMAAELLHLDKPDWSGLRLGLIEELEAHLHPQAQMKVIETLNRIESIQLILTTHSPNLASKIPLNKLIISRNNNCFPMGENYTKLDGKDYKFLERFLDVTKSNLFFAEGIILVEGWAEEIIIPALASHIGYSLTDNSVSVINVASTAFLRYSKIFLREEDGLDVPVAVITDLDVKPKDVDKKIEDIPITVHEKTKIETKYNAQLVKTFVSPKWTLEYCFFKSEALKEIFKKIVSGIHSGTDWEDFETELIKKLESKTLKKTEIAYQLAEAIKEDSEKEDKEFIINDEDSIEYLIRAIKYACGD
jgi:putative ATP-dependent endonuclease of OLD family